jgi:hypothetical protein
MTAVNEGHKSLKNLSKFKQVYWERTVTNHNYVHGGFKTRPDCENTCCNSVLNVRPPVCQVKTN